MAKWIDIGPAAGFTADAHQTLDVEGFSVVVCRVDDAVHAVANICPHAGLPLGEGDLQGCVLTCPFHGYAYDVRDGRNIDDPHDLPVMVYQTRVNDEEGVEVKLPIADEGESE